MSNRPQLELEAWRFTTTSACAREIVALLECTEYKLLVYVTPSELERLNIELDGIKTMGRVKVEMIG